MSTSAYQSYGEASKDAASPRDVEASLLIKAAQKLQAHRDSWQGMTDDLDQALVYNRKLWTVFSASLGEENHHLDLSIRQNLANLALFVFKQTLSIQVRPSVEKLNSLININRQLAAGLQGQGDDEPEKRAIA